MKFKMVSVRSDIVTMEKIRIIAEANNRSMNKEIEKLIKRHIDQYELEYGKIKVDLTKLEV